LLTSRVIEEQYKNKFSWKEISDPIYDYVYFNKEIEEEIINSIIIQRLRYIYQLQTTHLVYPGAVHSRFSHVVGVMHLAGIMAEDTLTKILDYYGKDALQDYRPDTLVEAVRLAGLLHDAGHACFGHAFEESILWNNRRSIPESVNNHEKIGLLLVKYLLEDKIKRYEDTYGLDNLYDVLLEILGQEEPHEPIIQLMRWLVKDSLYPSDILDFLRRDSYYAGTNEYGYIAYTRLIRNTYPYLDDHRPLQLLDRNTWGEFRAYLYAKANMFEHVYFHSVNRAFDRLLKTILYKIDDEVGLTEAVERLAEGDPQKYLGLVDVKLYSIMLDKAMRDEGEAGRLSRKLLIERKPEWKRIGREYILSGSKGANYVKWILRLTFNKDYKEKLRRILEERLQDNLKSKGVTEGDIWVDIISISPVPQSLLIPGKKGEPMSLLTLFMGKKKGKRIVKDRELYLIEEGIPLQVIYRSYIRRGLHRLEYEVIATETIESTVKEELGISDEEYRKVLSSVYSELSTGEAEKQRITV
jgi:HD superfamily phosphohydrolase